MKITQKLPIIFEPLHPRPEPQSKIFHTRKERTYKWYKVMY